MFPDLREGPAFWVWVPLATRFPSFGAVAWSLGHWGAGELGITHWPVDGGPRIPWEDGQGAGLQGPGCRGQAEFGSSPMAFGWYLWEQAPQILRWVFLAPDLRPQPTLPTSCPRGDL